MFQCRNAIDEVKRGWMCSSSCGVTSGWWHGTKLKARLALTAAFAHSNASCRPGPRPLSCCQHTDRLSWIISYLPNLSLQRRAPFGGALNHAAMVHRLQASFMDTLAPLSLLLCLFRSIPCSFSFLYHSVVLAAACHLAIPSLFASESKPENQADRRWKQQSGVREGLWREEAFVCLDRCRGPSLNFCQWSKEPMM